MWQQHHKRFFDFITENSDGIDRYLEIGGASEVCGKLSTLDFSLVMIIEPSYQRSSDSRLKYIRDFMKQNFLIRSINVLFILMFLNMRIIL